MQFRPHIDTSVKTINRPHADAIKIYKGQVIQTADKQRFNHRQATISVPAWQHPWTTAAVQSGTRRRYAVQFEC